VTTCKKGVQILQKLLAKSNRCWR